MKKTDTKDKAKAKSDATEDRLVPSDVAAEQAIYATKRDIKSSWKEIIAAVSAQGSGNKRFSYSD